jgi:hypothetical protein
VECEHHAWGRLQGTEPVVAPGRQLGHTERLDVKIPELVETFGDDAHVAQLHSVQLYLTPSVVVNARFLMTLIASQSDQLPAVVTMTSRTSPLSRRVLCGTPPE